MRLALRLGMTLTECKARISSNELAHWMALDRIDYFTVDKSEYMLAQVTAVMINMVDSRARAKAADFLLFANRQDKRQTTEEQKALFKGFLHGTDISTKR